MTTQPWPVNHACWFAYYTLLPLLPRPDLQALAEAKAHALSTGESAALAQALAEVSALGACYKECNTLFMPNCCSNNAAAVTAGKCGCIGSFCRYTLVSATPTVWQNTFLNDDICVCPK